MKDLAPSVPAPFVCASFVVQPDWIDVNGHMSLARYLTLFDLALDEVYPQLGFDAPAMAAANAGTFALETHITYRRELHEGDPIRITTQLMGFDERRCHYFQCIYHAAEGFVSATNEWLIVFVDMAGRRAASMPRALQARLAQVQAAHAGLPRDPALGRSISLANRRPE